MYWSSSKKDLMTLSKQTLKKTDISMVLEPLQQGFLNLSFLVYCEIKNISILSLHS